MPLSSIYTSSSNTTQKFKRKQQRLADTQHNVAKLRAKTAQDVFMEDSQRQRLMLNERLAQRGMAGGSHAKEELDRFEKAYQRGVNDLGYNITLAEQGGDLSDYASKAGKRFGSIALIEDILGTAAGIAVGAAGGGIPGATAGAITGPRGPSVNFNFGG